MDGGGHGAIQVLEAARQRQGQIIGPGENSAEIFTSLRMCFTPASNHDLAGEPARAQQAQGWPLRRKPPEAPDSRRPCRSRILGKIPGLVPHPKYLTAAHSGTYSVPMPQIVRTLQPPAARATMEHRSENERVFHERKAKIRGPVPPGEDRDTATVVDAEGHPQARIINVMLAEDDGMYIVTSRGKPFYSGWWRMERSPWQPCVQTASP